VLLVVLVLVLVLVLGGLRSFSINFVTVETMRIKMAFPASATARSSFLRTTRTSRHAAHSRAEPRAISRNRTRSGTERLPLPSAVFSATDVLASSRCLEHEYEHEHDRRFRD
jgi:hypothetical protein